MRVLIGFALFLTSFVAQAQSIEGYWQDSARRILFSRTAPAGYAYGTWQPLDMEQTYPTVKHIQRRGEGHEVTEMLYDDQEAVDVQRSTDKSIDFVRTTKWSGCAMHHRCSLEGSELACTLVNVCPDGGKGVVDWRGEERYVRRASCERQDKRQAQGVPVSCR